MRNRQEIGLERILEGEWVEAGVLVHVRVTGKIIQLLIFDFDYIPDTEK